MAERKPVTIDVTKARAMWLRAQRLDDATPFGEGPDAVRRAVEHLGYVQIDTINVIERCHHHILFSRIPAYRRSDLAVALTDEKSVFEYWTHALAYVPTADFRFFIRAMEAYRANPAKAFAAETDARAYSALLGRIRRDGALSIRDIDDDVLVEKTHPWGSRKPSKGALRFGFYAGDLAISRRDGMLKTYEIASRHFGWDRRPRPASDAQMAQYLLARALKAQSLVSLDSICYGDVKAKAGVAPLIEAAVKRRTLVPVKLEGTKAPALWASRDDLDAPLAETDPGRVHILSPFDPLVIQRKRLAALFGYEHRFEAYVPPDKRVLGYFALPVLAGDRIVAALDLKTDRKAKKLLIQKWTWLVEETGELKQAIDDELGRFERFQLAED